MSRAMHLGELLAFSASSSAHLRSWLQAADAPLADRVEQAAEARGETLAQFVRIAVSDFLAAADEESWASLLSSIRDAIDPGAACLARVTAFRLAMEATP